MNTWTIYMYQFPNKKKYIGKTKNTMARRQRGSHFRGYESCTLVYRAMQKYGFENIHQEILFKGQMEDEEATRLEQACILLFKTNVYRFNAPEYGYNLTDGGEGQKGRKLVGSELERSLRQLDEYRDIWRGSHHTEESKRKMSLAKKGRNLRGLSNKAKRIRTTNPQSGDVLFFDCQLDVADHFHVTKTMVCRWLTRNVKPRNGYIFEFVNSGNND